MQNGMIIPMLLIMAFFKVSHQKYIFQLTKCEHKGASESIDSAVKPQQIFQFF